MKALVLRKPAQADLETIADPVLTDTNVLLKVASWDSVAAI